MRHRIKGWLEDILAAINDIEQFLGVERNYFEYEKNDLLRAAVERKMEVIGEAVNRILAKDPTISITNARRIVDTRNFLIHSYDKIEDSIIWGIIINDFPRLKIEIEELLIDLS